MNSQSFPILLDRYLSSYVVDTKDELFCLFTSEVCYVTDGVLELCGES